MVKAEEWLAAHQEIIKICVPDYKGVEAESEEGAEGGEDGKGAEGGNGKEKAGEGEDESEGGAKEVVMGDAQASEGEGEGGAKKGDVGPGDDVKAVDDGMDLECNEDSVAVDDAEEAPPAPPAGPPLPTKFVQLSSLETCIMAADKINAHIDELEQMKVRSLYQSPS